MRGVYVYYLTCNVCLIFALLMVTNAEIGKDEMDKVIEDEITQKLSVDLLQSIERKFQVDLQKAVDSVLLKIKLLLENGTSQIQDKLVELQGLMDLMKKTAGNEVDVCLTKMQNETSNLAEKALHQMVICGYALIGHDPAQAVKNVMDLKNMITEGIKPLHEQQKEVYKLLKICGHDHDSLKKVIKCVIAKSPQIKSATMDITGKLIDGIVKLTKLMAHGAMHEACLIEVVKTIEDEAFVLVRDVKHCAYGTNSDEEVQKYIGENNATVVDTKDKTSKKKDLDMKVLLRRMIETESQKPNKDNYEKFLKMQQELTDANNGIGNEVVNKD